MNNLTILWPLDIIRCLIALCGTFFSVIETYDCVIDMRALNATGANGARRLVARCNVTNEALRLVLHVIFLGIAILAIVFPNAAICMVCTTTPTLKPMIISRLGLIFATCIVTVKSWIDRRTRAKLLVYWNDSQRAPLRRKTDA